MHQQLVLCVVVVCSPRASLCCDIPFNCPLNWFLSCIGQTWLHDVHEFWPAVVDNRHALEHLPQDSVSISPGYKSEKPTKCWAAGAVRYCAPPTARMLDWLGKDELHILHFVSEVQSPWWRHRPEQRGVHSDST